MNLLFSIDAHFIEQFKTTLLSIAINNPTESFEVFVIQTKAFPQEAEIAAFCKRLNCTYRPLIVAPHDTFEQAPTSKRYPATIYYRLLAHNYLPETVDKILYLDADILCINNLAPLYHLALDDQLYAAASHSSLTNMTTMFNKVRLKSYESEGYFNSGVLLMNLKKIREEVTEQAIANFIEENKLNLLLPDQDILNGLYGDRIIKVPDERYNYDVRKNMTYEVSSMGEWTTDWVIKNTVFLHFCGKDKPWLENYSGRYGALYKHYFYHLTKIY